MTTNAQSVWRREKKCRFQILSKRIVIVIENKFLPEIRCTLNVFGSKYCITLPARFPPFAQIFAQARIHHQNWLRKDSTLGLFYILWRSAAEGISQFAGLIEIPYGRLNPAERQISLSAIDKYLRITLI